MIRQLLLAAVATAAGAVFASSASAHDPRDDFRRDSRYSDRGGDRNTRFVVLVRHGGHWHEQGTYRDRDDAERVACRLERRGEDARVQRVGGWR